MTVLASIVRAIGYIWIGLVVVFGVYLGVGGAFLRMPGLLNQEGYGDIWVLMLIASPGLALVWLGNRVTPNSAPKPSKH